MISTLIALVAAAPAPAAPAQDEAAYRRCTALAKSDPEKALAVAGDWRLKGGGLAARQCLGLAYVELDRWAPAATAFEQAARDAETGADARRADLWVQAGNSWLAAGDLARARTAFDAALATTLLTPELRGEVHLDRARAAVALGDLAAARADIDKGLELVPADPFAWYLSAALAHKQGQAPRAGSDIAKAVELAPNDADVLLQAGTIAGTAGDIEAARTFYARAARAAPQSEAGRAAQAALTAPAEPASATPAPAAPAKPAPAPAP